MMALYAFLAVPQDLYPGQLAFRVGTPAAAQRAALEKNRGTDTGTIVDAEFLNIKEDTFCWHLTHSMFTWPIL